MTHLHLPLTAAIHLQACVWEGHESMPRRIAHTWARGTLSGSCTPKVMLYMMDSANSTGSWLTMDTCSTGTESVCLRWHMCSYRHDMGKKDLMCV